MKIVITGGHVTPALAVIETLKEKIPHVQIIFVGRKSTMEKDSSSSFEYQLMTNIPRVQFINLTTGRLRRFLSFHTLVSLFKIPIGLLQSFILLLREKPQVILTFGGYLGVPVVLAGWALRIPIVVHEQTFSLGLANKIIAFFADKVCVSSDANFDLYPRHKTVVTGNPLRKEIWQVNSKSQFWQTKKFNLPVLYITGGSQGAQFINNLIKRNLTKLLQSYVLIHQCGNSNNLADLKQLNTLIKELDDKLRQHYFLVTHIFPEDIGTVYDVANLVIGRAGANTVWELLALNKKALLIPLPYGQKQEQQRNAQVLQKLGLAQILQQEKFTDQEFLHAISQLIKKTTPLNKKIKNNLSSEKIVNEVLNVVSQQTN